MSSLGNIGRVWVKSISSGVKAVPNSINGSSSVSRARVSKAETIFNPLVVSELGSRNCRGWYWLGDSPRKVSVELVDIAILYVVSEEGKGTRDEHDFSGVLSVKTASAPFIGREVNCGGNRHGESLQHSSKFII